MIRRPPRSTLSSSSAASDVYKRQEEEEDVDYSSTPIPLPAVEAQHLELILDWCKTELAHKDEKEDLKKARNHEFFEDKDDSTIFAIIPVSYTHLTLPTKRIV
eukprot:TRINITY_DN994_c0_g1_i4.p2 TRINITY_DN994_c0_g1~~TRINITY_DN994_c0_g1_i4.p2  ORF type:complete len:103 (-),score=32.82 TRINITY_DN994_c0_g1_i4:147-455(-)